MKRAASSLALTLALTCSVCAQTPAPVPGASPTPGVSPPPVTSPSDTLADGATFVIERPTNWNGTLLLYSHGYRTPGANPAVDDGGEIAALRPLLLSRGFALAGSSYAKTGYAVEDALRDQMATLDVFERRYGKPKRTIAWGHSVGGLVTVALAEQHPDRIDGALAMCGVLAGTRAAWNQGLDAQYAFKTLSAVDAPSLHLVRIADPEANLKEAERIFAADAATPAGRARLALAAGFGEEPPWYTDRTDAPPASDHAARVAAMLAWLRNDTLPFGFGYRAELEARAGGNPSTNVGESYQRAFRQLPQRDLIAAEYSAAGLDLDADLKALDAGARVAADPAADTYAGTNVDVGDTLPVPVLTMHTVADGLVPVEHERTYAETVPVALRASRLRQLFVSRAGHCAFTSAETLVALESLVQRLNSGSWSNLDPVDLNDAARDYGDALNSFVTGDGGESPPVSPAFVEYVPKAFLR